jgi:ribonucleoside-diphosphate reductase alpha chain
MHFSKNKKINLNLSNCLFVGGPEDSIESIMEYASIHAKVLKYGYGNGINIDKIRPEGCKVNNAACTTAGIVPFMKLYSQVTNTIGHAGRRGASIITINDKHPDILSFIESKTKSESDITGANISIRVSDQFMQAVKEDLTWKLEYSNPEVDVHFTKEVKAKELFYKMCEANWDWAEPGLIFSDMMKNYNPGIINPECTPSGVNPCGEITIAPFEQCVLGSVVLDKFIKFEDDKFIFDFESYKKTISVGVKMLNAVIDYEIKNKLFPIKEIEYMAKKYRRIGLGITGLADVLGLLKLGYNSSSETMEFIDKLFSTLSIESYKTSNFLAENFDMAIEVSKDKNFFHTPFFNRLGRQLFPEGPVANISCNTIAPNGTLSIVSGGIYDEKHKRMLYTQCSSGLEPIIYREYQRTTFVDGEAKKYDVVHGAINYAKKIGGFKNSEIDKYFPTIKEVKWQDKVKIQGRIQRFIDNSISSTVNLPESATIKDVGDIYLLAWKEGCKGITVYRENCKRTAIIVGKSNKPKINDEFHIHRPRRVNGFTEKIKFPKYDVFVTVNKYDDKPFEVFVNVGKSGSEIGAFSEGLGRLVSLALSHDISADDVISQLEGIASDNTTWHQFTKEGKPKFVVSIMDAIAKVLEADLTSGEEIDGAEKCPKCKQKTLTYSEGCKICLNCGYSKCN